VRRRIGAFGVKDLFTLVNLLSGVIAVRFALSDRVRPAGYAVVVGFLCGDLLDGFVARRTGTGNTFGAEFDSLTDHFVHVVVPSLILYVVYQDGGHAWLGLCVVGALVGAATIRHARFAVERFAFPLCWCGLPRTIAGFAAMSFPLSTVFFARNPERYWTGFGVVTVLSLLTLLPVPYMTHRGERAMQPYVKLFVGLFIVTPVVVFVVDRQYAFDLFFFWIAGYALFGWFPVSRDERRRFYREYRRWSARVADAGSKGDVGSGRGSEREGEDGLAHPVDGLGIAIGVERE
jgi:phosphatidylserine synthase